MGAGALAVALLVAAALRPSRPGAARALVGRSAVLVTDDAVPEGHRDLHATLYGDAGAESAHRAIEFAWPGALDGSELLSLAGWLEDVRSLLSCREPRSAVGLYALYDREGAEQPWLVGSSRNVPAALAEHFAQDARRGRYARIRLLDSAPRMWTRERLNEECRCWARELGATEAAAASLAAAGFAAPEERRAHEERKLKLQLAMGENLNDQVGNAATDDAERRQNLIRAMEGDDWSAIVDGQTAEAVGRSEESPVRSTAGLRPVTVSPFAASASRSTAATPTVSGELTMSNVRAVLDVLRPMLKADGGDIEVVAVNQERGVVMLGLLGACETCPSAGTTMESGVEQALFNHFGRDVLREVVRVDKGAAELTPEGIRRQVQAHLDELQLSKDDGNALVAHCDAEGCDVELGGPRMLIELVRSSLSYRFPELQLRVDEEVYD